MIEKTEAQPEALRLADRLDLYATGDEHQRDVEESAAELRRQHAEMQQLKAENSRLQPTIEDDSQEWAKCDPAIAFHLIDRHSDNWADAGKMMTEFADAKAEVKVKALRDELTAQTNRAAAAEQQVTALTQRLDMANRLNTDAREQLAKLSARQAAPNPWQQAIDHELVCLHLGVAEDTTQESAAKALRELIQCHVEIAINPQTNGGLTLQPHGTPPPPEQSNSAEFDGIKTPPPEREPRTDEWHHNSRVESAAGIRDALSRMGTHLTITTILQLVDITRKAHGIGATND